MSKLLTVAEIERALNDINGMDPGTAQEATALDSLIQHVKALGLQLQRAHSAIAVLYVGNKARLPDGKVDVDLVIRACLGET